MKKTPTTTKGKQRAVFSPLALKWVRGPAWLDGDDVVLDLPRGTLYAPLAEPGLGLDLTKVKTPDDAVAFAQRYGLLSVRASSEDGLALAMTLREALSAPVPIRESAQSFIQTAAHLRGLVAIARDVRKGAEGDDKAIHRLRQTAKGDSRAILIGAADICAQAFTAALRDTWPMVYDRAAMGENVPPGRLRIGVFATTLKEACYLTIAAGLAEHEPIDVCAECSAAFVVEDARQRYCTPRCASRARFKRFIPKGAKHGKSTRKG
jgi:hypothetical protein